MRERLFDGRNLMEVGLLLVGGAVIAALGALVFGRGVGGAQRRDRKEAPPPSSGEVPDLRHRNVSAAATR